MADITVDVNLPSTISVDVTSPTQVLATNISIPGPQGPRGEKGNPTSINSLTAENIIITGADGNIVYNSGLNTIFISGNSGYFQSAVNSLTTNLNNTGANLNTSINNLSGLFTGYTGTLDATYATDSQLNSTGNTLNIKIDNLSGYVNSQDTNISNNLASTGSSLQSNINTLSSNLNSTGSTLNSSMSSLSGTLTSNYATIINLASTGSNLQNQINNLDNVYATDASVTTVANNLASTGNALETKIGSLSGTLTSNYATITNLGLTGSTLNNNINSLSGTLTSNYATITNLASTGSTLVSSINSLSSAFTGFTGNLDATYATDSQLTSTGSTLVSSINSLSGYINSSSSNIVFTTGNQTISGSKIFASPIYFISGANSEIRLGGSGGSIDLRGGDAEYDIIGGNGGNIIMRGASPNYNGNGKAGDINTSASSDAGGGNIYTAGGNENAPGGNIDTRGRNYNMPGGNINTSNGGGNIYTFGDGGAFGGSSAFGGNIYLTGKISVDNNIKSAGNINLSAGGGNIQSIGGNDYAWSDEENNNYYTFGGQGGSIILNGQDSDEVGNGANGGNINTSNGGGSIDTRGQGQIQFGFDPIRTTLSGTASQNRIVYLPDANGTLALDSNVAITGSTLNNSISSLSGTVTGNYVTKSNGQFTNRPTVNGTGILLSGEAASLPTTILYTTGNQIKSGRLIIGDDANSIVDPNSTYALSLQTNSPSTWLEILNNSGANKGVFFGIQNNDFEQYNWQAGDIKFFTSQNFSDGTERLRIKNNGKVGIGTSSPSELLEVSGNIKASGASFIYRPTVNGTGVLLSGEVASLPATIVYTTGNQTISGNKNFVQNVIVGDQTQDDLLVVSGNEISFGVIPTVSGNPLLTGIDLSSYATVANLASTGSTLDTKINNLSGYINSSSSNIVFTTGNQTISGVKNFTNNLVFQDNLFQISQASGYLTGIGYSGNYDGGYFLGDTKLSQNTRRLVENSFGKTWVAKDSERTWWGIAISSNGQYQTAIVYNGQIYVSSDYGNSWVARESSRAWVGIDVSSDGKYQTAVVNPGFIYVSSDYGNTWVARESSSDWVGIAVSSNGQYQTALGSNTQIYVSSDYGNSWVARESSRAWVGIDVSSDGKYQTAVVNLGFIYVSSDYGNTWVAKDSSRGWYGVSISSDGKYQTAVVNPGFIYVSSDYGNTWVAKDSSRDWYGVSISSDGKYQTAVGYFTYTYVSSDYGNSWVPKYNPKYWRGVAVSSDGKYQTAVGYNEKIFVSNMDERIDGNLYADNVYGNNLLTITGNQFVDGLKSINNSLYLNNINEPKTLFSYDFSTMINQTGASVAPSFDLQTNFISAGNMTRSTGISGFSSTVGWGAVSFSISGSTVELAINNYGEYYTIPISSNINMTNPNQGYWNGAEIYSINPLIVIRSPAGPKSVALMYGPSADPVFATVIDSGINIIPNANANTDISPVFNQALKNNKIKLSPNSNAFLFLVPYQATGNGGTLRFVTQGGGADLAFKGLNFNNIYSDSSLKINTDVNMLGKLDLNKNKLVNSISETININSNFTITDAYNGRIVLTNSATTTTGTLVPGIVSGFNMSIIQGGVGQVQITGNLPSILLNSFNNQFKTAGRFANVSLLNTGNDGYILYGNTSV